MAGGKIVERTVAQLHPAALVLPRFEAVVTECGLHDLPRVSAVRVLRLAFPGEDSAKLVRSRTQGCRARPATIGVDCSGQQPGGELVLARRHTDRELAPGPG